MTLSTPSRPPSTPASGPLRREQIDAPLEELRDPAMARQFLMDAASARQSEVCSGHPCEPTR